MWVGALLVGAAAMAMRERLSDTIGIGWTSGLPIGPPTRFELAIHAGSANAMRLTIPPSVLGRADAVIQ